MTPSSTPSPTPQLVKKPALNIHAILYKVSVFVSPREIELALDGGDMRTSLEMTA